MATYKAINDVAKRDRKFFAALQGVDIDEDDADSSSGSKTTTIEEVQARAVARLTGDQNLAGAISEGLTPDMGVQYMIVEGAEIG